MSKISISTSNASASATVGCCVGCSIATVLSWTTWHSIWWMILHANLGWLYVLYYIIKYL